MPVVQWVVRHQIINKLSLNWGMIPTKSYTVDQALAKLQRYCSYQERCHMEVRQKLKQMRMIPDAVEHIISKLIEDDYLNETRFAKTYVSGKFKIKHWGRDRLVRELKQRGISKYNINYALAEIDEAEYTEVFNALAEKKLVSLQGLPKMKKKRKLADYLLYRGWESSRVYHKVSKLIP